MKNSYSPSIVCTMHETYSREAVTVDKMNIKQFFGYLYILKNSKINFIETKDQKWLFDFFSFANGIQTWYYIFESYFIGLRIFPLF